MLLFDAVSLYGLVYAAGFVLLMVLLRTLIRPRQSTALLLFYSVYLAIGGILGGRLGYVLLYEPSWYLAHPADIPALYKGGMSFHGALCGVVLAACVIARTAARRLQLLDVCAVCAVICLPLGRICNFLNGELAGRVSAFDWGFVFAGYDDRLRYPSQLFEALAEGPLTALAMYLIWKHSRLGRKPGIAACVFGISYALWRFLLEFVREPDATLGLLALGLSMGQWLSLLQLVCAGALALWLRHRYSLQGK